MDLPNAQTSTVEVLKQPSEATDVAESSQIETVHAKDNTEVIDEDQVQGQNQVELSPGEPDSK